ncbi:MAG: CIA30 family protein [Saprospiraceae bacterium]
MKYLLIFAFLMTALHPITVFDFNANSDLTNWRIVDDVVMGGRSDGNFKINEEGHGLFQGKVSLENNGGFSSVRYRFDKINLKGHTKIVIRVKGDGKRYQFRVKDEFNNYYSYITYFTAPEEWQEIELPLADMYPSFRGRKLDFGNFAEDHITELAILIGNKEPQEFELLIDKIELQ